MLVPWRRVASWHCNACGVCCKFYKPKLTLYEYLKLLNTGFVEEKSGRFYLRKINGRCPFQYGRLCTLQHTMKPLSCKMFPFTVYTKGDEDALIEVDGEEYYVYVDPFCPNVRIKPDTKPVKKVYELAKEAVMIFSGRSNFKLLTAQLTPESVELQQLHHHLARV